MKNWRVSKYESGQRLTAFLQTKHEKLSAKKIKRAIEHHLCSVNGTVQRFASYRVKEGDRIRFEEEGVASMPPKVYELDRKRILHEDEHLIFYDKPAGLASDETGLAAIFSEYYLVHRLDRETTGVIVFAKSQEVQNKMIELFRKKKVEKCYFALVDGVLEKPSGMAESYIGRVYTDGGYALWGEVSPKQGKLSRTKWECVRQGKEAALVKCVPETGRTHQIRVHLKGIGHPVLGDYRYSKEFYCSYPAKRCMLHASSLSFPHPTTGNVVAVESPLPADFQEAKAGVLS